ncbi:hypothetical protein ACFL5S_00255 [Fibrobacterota bacterium]
MSHRFIHLKPDTSGKFAGYMAMSTEKKDFKVKEISFEQKKKKDTPEWQLSNDIVLSHTMTSSDTTDDDGYFTYTLHFSCNITPPKEMLSGSFIFKTNHPKKETIKLRGMINPKKN